MKRASARLAVLAAIGALVGTVGLGFVVYIGTEALGGYDGSLVDLIIFSVSYGASVGAVVVAEGGLLLGLFRRSAALGVIAALAALAALAVFPASWYSVIAMVLIVPAVAAIAYAFSERTTAEERALR